jgi:hypothetical protein
VTTPTYVHEPVLVQARFQPDGRMQPTAFIWQNRTRYISDLGRQWQETSEGATWHCFLVQTPSLETFELRYDPSSGRWLLERAWQHDSLA